MFVVHAMLVIAWVDFDSWKVVKMFIGVIEQLASETWKEIFEVRGDELWACTGDRAVQNQVSDSGARRSVFPSNDDVFL